MTAFWALTLNTIRMTTRRLAAMVTVTFILLGSLFMYSFIEGDNTLIGLLRVVVTWSFSFISGLLMLLVLYFSSTVLDAEMVGKQIYLLDVKPVPRWKILAGKCAGLAIVSGCLLLVMGGLTYGALRWLAHAPPASASARAPAAAEDADGAAAIEESDRAVDSELFVSRTSWRPRLTHEDRFLDELAEKLKGSGRIDAAALESPSVRATLRALLERRLPPIRRGESLDFTFTGLPPPAAGRADLDIRYKLYGRRGREPEIELRHEWRLGPAGTPPPLRRDLASTAGRTREFRASCSAVSPDGTLRLSLTNLTGDPEDDPAAELLVPGDGIELLVPSGSFEMNFIRALVLLWVRLGMLAALGIAASTFLSGRVAAFFLLGLILTGSLGSFVRSLVAPDKVDLTVLELDHSGHDHSGHHHVDRDASEDEERGAGAWLVDVWKTSIVPVIFRVLPDFEETDPAPDLLIGREIGWGRVGRQALYDVGLRAGLVWLLGLYCFYRREVGLPVTD